MTDDVSRETLGLVAYRAYHRDARGVTFDGRAMPLWDNLGDDVRRHWIAAANAVALHTLNVSRETLTEGGPDGP